MQELGNKGSRHRRALHHLGLLTAVGLAAVAGSAEGCGDSAETTPATTISSASSTSSASGTGGATTTTSSASSASGTGGAATTSSASSAGSGAGGSTSSSGGGGSPTSAGTGGSGGGAVARCAVVNKGPSRGSAIAITPDDSRLIAVNRDAGSVTVMAVDYSDGQPKMTPVAEIPVGGEPWQAAIDGCGHTAYVVLRKDQKVVRIDDLDGTPVKGAVVAVGSEPTSLALTPNGSKLYVSNWVDGTLSVIDPAAMIVTGTVDLNPILVANGGLGPVTPRPALAHPRAIAITNNGDGSDADETVFATEWFATRTAPEDATGTKSDTAWKGLLYRVKVSDDSADSIDLPAVTNTGFKDIKDQDTGCFPNQVGSVTLDGGFAYVTSTCASPVGPIGVFTGANAGGACTVATQAADCGAGGTCTAATLTCAPNTRGVKTTTHPALSVVNIAAGSATTVVLDKLYETFAGTSTPAATLRVPLLPTDIDFINGFGYITGEGTDAVFRFQPSAGVVTSASVGSPGGNVFINLRKGATDAEVRLPIGVATARGGNHPFAFVADDGTRDVTALALNTDPQAIAGNAATNDFRITPSSAFPSGAELTALRGKRFFNTGLGRWSLAGQGWGSCGACHVDGLTDDVTWYFARGPRQTVSLDGTFASNDGTDQRILNWTAIFDEVADFESNTRGISGGVGALVTAAVAGTAPTNADRIDTAAGTPPQQGLQGSSSALANPLGPAPHTVLNDWQEIEAWIKTIRSPRKPSTLVQADVDAGKILFSSASQGNCIGCHGGAKWTLSRRFYTPDNVLNDSSAAPGPSPSLSSTSWATAAQNAAFPTTLLPSAAPATNGFMRFGLPPGAEQIQCILRPVGTIAPPAGGTVPVGVSKPEVNVLELRQDMVTGAQGVADSGRGFNPPSLLGMSVGAPYFHAGNARTLEEVFDGIFKGHHQSAIANIFDPNSTSGQADRQIQKLVAYVLSIDESEGTFPIPAVGKSAGGDFCFHD